MFFSYQLTMSFWSRVKLLFGIPIYVELSNDDSKPDHLHIAVCVLGEEYQTVTKAKWDRDTGVITTE